MELLLGCGTNHKKRITFEGIPDGWTNLTTLDIDGSLNPDVEWDLNDTQLPFDDNQFNEVHAYEVLEHVGRQGDWRFFFDQFTDFHRILKPGGYFCATVPLWHDVWAWADPGHTRSLPAEMFTFLSQKEYIAQVGVTQMTDYRFYYKADFDLIAKTEEKGTLGIVMQAVK